MFVPGKVKFGQGNLGTVKLGKGNWGTVKLGQVKLGICGNTVPFVIDPLIAPHMLLRTFSVPLHALHPKNGDKQY